ncbi:MAG: hypothetical protein MJ054_01605, partial [Clostridia bacterium]|nr:hypothetical protein [Clostridia bacterium]
SCFRVRKDKKFGDLYLYGLSATDAPIPFIVTSFKETDKRTIIEFEFIIGEGEATKLQHLSATCTDKEIRIKAVEEHKVDIIQQKYNDIDSLKYEVTLLVFGLNTEDK